MNCLRLIAFLQFGSVRNTYRWRPGGFIDRTRHSVPKPTELSVARGYATPSSTPQGADPPPEAENTNVSHSRFLAEASPAAKWKSDASNSLNGGNDASWDEFEGITEGRGKLSPTSSHLFKLILPLGTLSHPANKRHEPPSADDASAKDAPKPPPTVILLHPSQPLSHVSRLILASLAPATPTISFRSISRKGQAFQWSDSTDVGDFIRDAARAAKFSICITYGDPAPGHPALKQAASRYVVVDETKDGKGYEKGEGKNKEVTETILDVEVPTFADRTRFLRRRLGATEKKLQAMEGLKNECDREAHRGAKRMAMGGFAMLVVYWGAVARLTFWDYGWEIMEPITYLSGLSTVILGYLWFLYQGREVSYTSVLDRSISARREALYKARGLDIEQWVDLVSERKGLRKEIARIAEDYDQDSKRSSAIEEEDEEDEDIKAKEKHEDSGIGARVLEKESDTEEDRGKRE
ncbi:hypothetical protein BDQ12DRAFT_660071 [Crucibulum laeve]|uniref:Calcium uniporter protein, mitochondrial n=1 Tax=Crucibulum laeve TaxID=68775 RepID=A0A5C3LGE7_9AGAR|nr:hypothetical protein BDQ12DRAFT_660071 [Crucibulum laeve]